MNVRNPRLKTKPLVHRRVIALRPLFTSSHHKPRRARSVQSCMHVARWVGLVSVFRAPINRVQLPQPSPHPRCDDQVCLTPATAAAAEVATRRPDRTGRYQCLPPVTSSHCALADASTRNHSNEPTAETDSIAEQSPRQLGVRACARASVSVCRRALGM